MNKSDFLNICLILAIGILSYIIFRRLNYQEGFDVSGNTPSSSTITGAAGGAANYASQIKSKSINLQDIFLISKYRADYENTIINMDELVNYLMLQVVLSVDQTNPQQSLAQLVELNNSKAALNNVMKFIDSN